MTEERRTRRVDIQASLNGAEFESDVRRAATALEQLAARVQQNSAANEKLKATFVGTGAAADRFIDAARRMTDIEAPIRAYTSNVAALAAAFRSGDLLGGVKGFQSAIAELSRTHLKDAQKEFAFTSKEVADLATRLPYLRASAERTAAGMLKSAKGTADYQVELHKLTQQLLVNELTEQRYAASAARASEQRRVAWIRERLEQQKLYEVQRAGGAQTAMQAQVSAFANVRPVNLDERDRARGEIVRAFEEGFRAQRIEAQKLVQAYDLLQAEVAQTELKLAGLASAQLDLQRAQQNGVPVAGGYERALQAIGLEAEKTEMRLRELRAQQSLAPGATPLVSRIENNVTGGRGFGGTGQVASQSGLAAVFAADEAAVRRLTAALLPAEAAKEELARTQAQLNDLHRRGVLDTSRYGTMVAQVMEQERLLATGKGGLNNAYTRQLVIQSALVNSIQTLAAGGGIMQTLFIQSTQLLGVFGNISSAVLGIGVAVTAVGVTMAGIAVAVARVGEQFELARARIIAMTGSMEYAQQVSERLVAVGLNTGVSATEGLGSFSRLLVSNRELRASQEELVKLTQLFQQLGVIGGGTSQEITNGMRQFTQAVGKGRLDGDELRSVLENMPALGQRIAQSFNVSVGELRDMGAQGRLLTNDVIGRLLNQSRDIQAQFDRMPVTMTRGFGQLGVAISAVLDQLNRKLELTQTLGRLAANAARLINNIRVGNGGSSNERAELLQGQIAQMDAREVELERRLAAVPARERNQPAGAGFLSILTPTQRMEQQLTQLRAYRGQVREEYTRLQQELAGLGGNDAGDGAGAGGNSALRTAVTGYIAELRTQEEQISRTSRESIDRYYSRRMQENEQNRILIEQQVLRMRADVTTPATDLARGERDLELVTQNAVRITREQAEALKQLEGASGRAAAAEGRRIDTIQRGIETAREALGETGISREVRAYTELTQRMRAASADRNAAALSQSQMNEALETQGQLLVVIERRNRTQLSALQLATEEQREAARIQQLEARGTREATAEIDRMTQARALTRIELEKEQALMQVNRDLAVARNEAEQASVPAIRDRARALAEELERQRAGIEQTFAERSRIAVDPANSRLARQIEQESKQVTDRITDFFSQSFARAFDQTDGGFKDLMKGFRTAALSTFAQIASRAIIRPIVEFGVQQIIGTPLGAVLGGSGGLGSLFGGGGLGSISAGGAKVGGNAATNGFGVGLGEIFGGLGLGSRLAGGGAGSIFGGSGSSGIGSWFGGIGNRVGDFLSTPLYTQPFGTPGFGPSLPGAGPPMPSVSIGQTLGGIAGIAGGAFGIYSGIQKGGIGGAVGALGGAAGLGAGIATLTGIGASLLPILGPLAIALPLISMFLPGQKPSSKAGTATLDLASREITQGGFEGAKFSQANRDAASAVARSIADQTRKIETLTGFRPGGSLAVEMGDRAPGAILYSRNGEQRFERDEAGLQALAQAASAVLLDELKVAAQGFQTLEASVVRSSTSLEDLEQNFTFLNDVYKPLVENVSAFAAQKNALAKTYDEAITKAASLGLETSKLTQLRDEELARMQRIRNREVDTISRSLAAQANGQTALSSMIEQQAAAATAVEDLAKKLKDLGATAKEVERDTNNLIIAQLRQQREALGGTIRQLQGGAFIDAIQKLVLERQAIEQGGLDPQTRALAEKANTLQLEAVVRELSPTMLDTARGLFPASYLQTLFSKVFEEQRVSAVAQQRDVIDRSQGLDVVVQAREMVRGFEQLAPELGRLGLTTLAWESLSKQLEGFMSDLSVEQLEMLTAFDDMVGRLEDDLVRGIAAAALAQRRAAEAQEAAAREMERLLAAGESLRGYIDARRGVSSPGGPSPQDALVEAQAQFARDLTLARANDEDALGRIATVADRLLEAAQAMYASSPQFQSLREMVLSSLQSLPATQRYDESLLAALSALGGPALFATGGMVRGGLPGVDSVPALLQQGEGVLSVRGMAALGEATLNGLNNGRLGMGGGSNNELVAEVRELRMELRKLRGERAQDAKAALQATQGVEAAAKAGALAGEETAQNTGRMARGVAVPVGRRSVV